MNYLEGLNQAQKKAVIYPLGTPLLVVAGAGTGKTKTLTARMTHLIYEHKISPSEILALTFTNKAAREMNERVFLSVGEKFLEGFPLLGKTFHSLGVLILREQHERLGLSRYFKILDSDEVSSLMKQAMKTLEIDTKEWEPRTISSIISRAKGARKTHETFEGKNPTALVAAEVWTVYEDLKKQEQALDFDDLLLETYLLLKKNPDILHTYQERWKYFLIDEYQDTNVIQYEIIRLLVGDREDIFVVGDSDQNIYSWRGADMRNILNFEKDFPKAQVIILEENYRSTQTILRAADEIISKNSERIPKELVTNNPEGHSVLMYEAASGQDEAHWVVKKIAEYHQSGYAYGDCAILMRTNFQSRLIEEACLLYGIPYHVVGTRFFERKEIKDIMAYLRCALGGGALSDLKRIINEPKRGIGKVALAKIFANQVETLPPKTKDLYQKFKNLLAAIQMFAHTNPPSETIKFIIEESGFSNLLNEGTDEDKEHLLNMKELVTYAKKYDALENPYEKFLDEVALLSDQDSLDKEATPGVRIMTIHAAKGLEFEVVFLVGCEQGLFPSERNDSKDKYETEEERRLCYVAFTRAKKILNLSFAQMRTIYGQTKIQEPSEFIHDIPTDIVEREKSEQRFFGSFQARKQYGDLIYDDEEGDDDIETFYLDF